MGMGEGTFQHSAMMRYTIDGRDIHTIPAEIAIDLESLIAWRDWIEESGGSVRSRSGTAMSLLRASLEAPLKLRQGEHPDIGSIIGGRIHGCKAFEVYPEIEIWDISAAYARTLASLPYNGAWRIVRKLDLDSDAEQFAQVAVCLPEMEHGPLTLRDRADTFGWWQDVYREREFPTGTTITGIWSSDELRAALNVGGRIVKTNTVYRLFSSGEFPFAQWWENVERGRSLPGKAGALAKIIGNVLWGVFAFSAKDRKLVRYANRPGRKREKIVKELYDPAATNHRRDLALAELVTSKVRAKVYNEHMLPAGNRLISVCVDGGLTRPGFTPAGDHWRLKDRGTGCAFLKPYVYAYERATGQIVYKVAGVPERNKASFFQAIKAERFNRRQQGMGNPSSKKVALHRLSEAFPGSCIDRETASEVDRYFGSLADANR
jgi:hypothetical protein